MIQTSFFQEIYKKTINTNYGFYSFCDMFARIVEENASFEQKVYQIIQDYFQYFILENTKKSLFLLETSPRTGKSLLVTILGSVFVGLRNPKKKGLIVTANMKTMKDFFNSILAVVHDPFFLQVTGYKKNDFNHSGSNFIYFPNGFTLKFQTTQSQTPIGQGFHFIWLDDFLTYEDTISEARSYRAEAKLTSLMTRRMYDVIKKTTSTKVIVANQRLNFNDISARYIKSYTHAGIPFLHLTLPFHFKVHGDMEYKLHNGKTIYFQYNEYLRDVFSEQNEKEIKADLNNDARFKTEYLQIPTQSDIQIFNIENLQYYNKLEDIQNITNLLITADIAFKTNKNNDYTAIVVWGVDLQDTKKPKVYALDIIHHKEILDDTIKILKNTYNHWKDFRGKNNHKPFFQGLLLEDVTSNEGLFMELKRDGNIYFQKLPRASNDKVARANLVVGEYNQKIVYLPAFHKCTAAFVNELQQFSRNNTHKHDDLTDNLIDVIQWGVKEQVSNNLKNYLEGINSF